MVTVPDTNRLPAIQKRPGQSEKQLQEDKSIILYVLNKIKIGCSRDRLIDILLRNIQFNYFDLQGYLDELIADGLILLLNDAKERQTLMISQEGKSIINEIFPIIPAYLRELIDLYLKENQNQIQNQIAVNAHAVMMDACNFEANLSLYENDLRLIDLKINVPTEKDALELCKKWKADYQQVYAKIIQDFNA